MAAWLYAAIAGYFLSACSKVLDKIILARAVPDPIVFTFFAGLLSGFVLILMPFGYVSITSVVFTMAMVAGICILSALYFLYSALSEYDSTRVIPLVASMSPFITLGLSVQVLHGRYTQHELYAFLFLVFGGLLLLWDPRTSQKIQSRLFLKTLIASMFLSTSYIFTKLVFNNTPFLSGIIWTRLGIFFSALLLFTLPQTRRALRAMPRMKPRYGGIFVVNKIIGASGLLSINYAINSGSPALVNALGSFEYFFVFLLSLGITLIAPRILREDISLKAFILKLGGSVALGISLVLLFYP